jgi:hypothetical protein
VNVTAPLQPRAVVVGRRGCRKLGSCASTWRSRATWQPSTVQHTVPCRAGAASRGWRRHRCRRT